MFSKQHLMAFAIGALTTVAGMYLYDKLKASGILK